MTTGSLTAAPQPCQSSLTLSLARVGTVATRCRCCHALEAAFPYGRRLLNTASCGSETAGSVTSMAAVAVQCAPHPIPTPCKGFGKPCQRMKVDCRVPGVVGVLSVGTSVWIAVFVEGSVTVLYLVTLRHDK